MPSLLGHFHGEKTHFSRNEKELLSIISAYTRECTVLIVNPTAYRSLQPLSFRNDRYGVTTTSHGCERKLCGRSHRAAFYTISLWVGAIVGIGRIGVNRSLVFATFIEERQRQLRLVRRIALHTAHKPIVGALRFAGRRDVGHWFGLKI